MDKSILRELCSWSSSLTNLSFYKGKDAEKKMQERNTTGGLFATIWLNKVKMDLMMFSSLQV